MNKTVKGSAGRAAKKPRRQFYFVQFESQSDLDIFLKDQPPSIDFYKSETLENLLIVKLTDQEAARLRAEGIEVIRTLKYGPAVRLSLRDIFPLVDTHPRSLNDVLKHIKADRAWSESRGAGVHIAIIDTGVCGLRAEFPASKRSPHSHTLKPLLDPWRDANEHGTMLACIAASTNASGGQFTGVAPDATLISCRLPFNDYDEAYLFQMYEHLIGLIIKKVITGPLVINNSFGYNQDTAPVIHPGNKFIEIVKKAVSLGITSVFSAGNNHFVHSGGKNSITACSPGTIWSANSLDEVITVGTVDENESMKKRPSGLKPTQMCHVDSSRGPGQLGTNKPDCVAPTYGRVLRGCKEKALIWWGTSGAAPQVAGLAALMLAKNKNLKPADIKRIILQNCKSLPDAQTCVGAGLIDCEAAVAATLPDAEPLKEGIKISEEAKCVY